MATNPMQHNYGPARTLKDFENSKPSLSRTSPGQAFITQFKRKHSSKHTDAFQSSHMDWLFRVMAITRVTPLAWLQSYVTLVLYKGNPFELANYMPITLVANVF
jgi:hypothetical protein